MIENLTLKWFSDNMGFIVALIGSLSALYIFLKKLLQKVLKPMTDQIISFETNIEKKITEIEKNLRDKISDTEKTLKLYIIDTDMNATKNFLVAQIEEIKRNDKVDQTTIQRFWEEYEHYKKDLHGNSYIEKEVKKLEKQGKL